MPSKINVKVTSIDPASRGNYNGLEIKGYDATNNDKYKQFCFEQTQQGDLTKVAAVLQQVGPGEWLELTCDDSKYKNVTFAKKIAEPANGVATPPGGGNPAGGGSGRNAGIGGGGSDKMSKEDWAAKDLKKATDVARSVALKAAVAACSADGGKVTKPKMEQIEKMSLRMEAFLLTGDFDGPIVKPAVVDSPPVPEETDNEQPTTTDDDIPF